LLKSYSILKFVQNTWSSSAVQGGNLYKINLNIDPEIVIVKMYSIKTIHNNSLKIKIKKIKKKKKKKISNFIKSKKITPKKKKFHKKKKKK